MGVAILTWRIPKIAADALSGTASLSAGEALQIAAAAMAGAVGATAVGAKLAEKTVDSVTDVLGKASSNIPAFSSVNAISNLTSDSKPSVSVPDPTGPAPDGNAYSGNAKGATISGAGANASEGNVEKMFEKFAAQNQNRNLSDRLQDGLRSFQSAIPNDQATVGGDLVRNHSDG
jgi:type IV secretion system protein TrbL